MITIFKKGDWATVIKNRDVTGVYHDFMIGEQVEVIGFIKNCVLCTNERGFIQCIYQKDLVLGRQEIQ